MAVTNACAPPLLSHQVRRHRRANRSHSQPAGERPRLHHSNNGAPLMRIERRLVQHLKSLSPIVRVSKGTRLFTQGEPANQACVIEMGRVRLWLADDQGTPIWSRIVGSGSVLGLPSSISGRPYSLTAVAIESVDVAFVGRDALQEVITTNPEVSTAVLRILSEELSQLRQSMGRDGGNSRRKRRVVDRHRP